ncbi:DUF6973 domain-containing protein [Deinococcus cellulosilyticus]|uniref:DUF6973 domain-containing protein n=1 Tax=Deinococcus cellulosilyticus (strain DSM 18568 / NBRC 106333 / KACC 11606 / 5516J-15) TaxID=1223518 RepID=A0A511N7C5_DEIC1|nr:hypothetical protein [Deinococcus cellulosilyticus]GEM48321.1 hypothetical protein DC3_39560 [Deinococcus cellulosilyticus NBRC 106333 = KACC 11606]
MKRSKIVMLLAGLLLSSCSTQIKDISADESKIHPSDYQRLALQNMEHLNAEGVHFVKEKKQSTDPHTTEFYKQMNEVILETLKNPQFKINPNNPNKQQLYPYSSLLPQDKPSLNPMERALCDQNAWNCLNFLDAGYVASQQSGTDFSSWQSYSINNEKDAFRHSYWNAVMTITMSYTWAQNYADTHEQGSPTQIQGGVGQQMDYHNNAVGRNVANNLPNMYKCKGVARAELHKAMRDGRLKIAKRNYFTEQVDELVGNQRYLTSSNAWSASWPASYKDLIDRLNYATC